MSRKYHLTTILIIAVFFLSSLLMARAFTCAKAGELNHFLLNHYVGDERDTDEEWRYSELFLEEKCHRLFFLTYLDWIDSDESVNSEMISKALPKTQLEMFLSFHDSKYMHIGHMLRLNDEEEKAALIALTSWHHLADRNYDQPFESMVRDYAIFAIAAIVVIGVFAFRRKLYKDKESEESMANTLSKGLALEMTEPMNGLRDALVEWKNADESEKSAYSGKVIAEIDQMDEDIKNLLQLRDLDAGNVDLHFDEVNLHHLMTAVLKRLDPILEKKKLMVYVDSPSPEDCIVKADPQILKIALSNVIMKTADYSSRKVRINLVAGRRVHFQVVSDDYQIPKDEARSVWKLHSLYDDCMTDEVGSSGVGLSAVARMLNAHKAKYGCCPVKGGTMLWFAMKRIRNHE